MITETTIVTRQVRLTPSLSDHTQIVTAQDVSAPWPGGHTPVLGTWYVERGEGFDIDGERYDTFETWVEGVKRA